MTARQLRLPWHVRVLIARPFGPVEELMASLAERDDPVLGPWAREARHEVRDLESLLLTVLRLESCGAPLARELARAVRFAWSDFGGVPLPVADPLEELMPSGSLARLPGW